MKFRSRSTGGTLLDWTEDMEKQTSIYQSSGTTNELKITFIKGVTIKNCGCLQTRKLK